MGAVSIIAPIVIAAWPGFAATVLAAATSLGFQAVEGEFATVSGSQGNQSKAVNLDIAHSDIVTNSLGRDQKIVVSRDGVTVTFSRDARGKAGLCVTGNHSEETLLAVGKELSQRVVQKHVHARLLEEMQQRGYTVVEDVTEANETIRLRVRHWEN